MHLPVIATVRSSAWRAFQMCHEVRLARLAPITTAPAGRLALTFPWGKGREWLKRQPVVGSGGVHARNPDRKATAIVTRHTTTFALCALTFALTALPGQAEVLSTLTELPVPSSMRAEEPSLIALDDGRVLMTWTELTGDTYAEVRIAILDGEDWSAPMVVASGDDIFVNYADFPSAVALEDGTLAVHWLRMNGDSYYAYDVNIALSNDGGTTWGETIVPHRDGAVRQHGFVSLLPEADGGLLAIWLDGRNYDTTDTFGSGEDDANAMQLRTTGIGTDGTLTEDLLLDARTCTCCQTTAVAAGDGTVLLAYRDRTVDEIRDISVVRRVDGVWTDPMPVSGDGWEIAGCPINGPALDAQGADAALVWFTAAGGVPAVKLAFSDDAGASFGEPFAVDLGNPAGSVDVELDADGTAIVSWIERTAAGEVLLLCRASAAAGCEDRVALTVSSAGRTMGFPRMAQVADAIYVAWTESTLDAAGRPDGGSAIRMARGSTLPDPAAD